MLEISNEKIEQLLGSLYQMALEGVPKTPSVEVIAKTYLDKSNQNIEQAIDDSIRSHIIKNSSNGFLCGLGGKIVLAVSIPAEITASLYLQMRMIMCIAILTGHDPRKEETKRLLFLILSGKSLESLAEAIQLKPNRMLPQVIMNKIYSEPLGIFNKLIAKKLKKKLGKLSGKSLGKWLPLVGGAIGAGVEYQFTKSSGNLAKEIFLQKNTESKPAE